jgi:CheY-like chemotaxis protein
MNVLLVDDDKVYLQVLRKDLKNKEYDVFVATNGVDALKIISDEKIDLIISDIMMPCISGFTLLTMLKEFYFSKIPLILISGYDNPDIEKQSMEKGASCFMSKPIDSDKLCSVINQLTQLKKAG